MSKRTQYVKLSLTDAEYDALESFSEEVNKPVAYCIRMMIERIAEISDVFTKLKDGWDSMEFEDQQKLYEQFRDSELDIKDKLKFYQFIDDMKHISKFSSDWKEASAKQIF